MKIFGTFKNRIKNCTQLIAYIHNRLFYYNRERLSSQPGGLKFVAIAKYKNLKPYIFTKKKITIEKILGNTIYLFLNFFQNIWVIKWL